MDGYRCLDSEQGQGFGNLHAAGLAKWQPDPVTSTDTTSLRAIAARNNADWCASVCRSHGIADVFGELAWCSVRRSPLYYPDAVTLHPDAALTDFLPRIDTESPGCSVKDSFSTLDLSADGFVELFSAQWIHRPAGFAPPESTLRTAQVSTAAQLRDWQTGWHGGDATADVFRPALLDDPSVLVLAIHDGHELCGGAVLNRSPGVVGLSNLFAVSDGELAGVWSSAVHAAVDHFPDLPIVGYEQADDLAPALASGFSTLGALRVWLSAADPASSGW